MKIQLLNRLALDTPLVAASALSVMLATCRGPMTAELPAVTEFKAKMKPKMTVTDDGLAIIPIKGVLARNPDIWELAFFGFEDMVSIEELLDQAARSSSVKGVLLDIDSPGGFVNGTPELGDAVARMGKPTVAFTAGMACSAAYWIASQADTVVASRSAVVGSIGVYAALYDLSAYFAEMGVKVEVFTNDEGTFKGAGIQGTSLTDEQRANFKARVQRDFNEFSAAVLSKRPGIAADTMRGQTFNGNESKANGLVDAVGNQAFALSVLRQKLRTESKR